MALTPLKKEKIEVQRKFWELPLKFLSHFKKSVRPAFSEQSLLNTRE